MSTSFPAPLRRTPADAPPALPRRTPEDALPARRSEAGRPLLSAARRCARLRPRGPRTGAPLRARAAAAFLLLAAALLPLSAPTARAQGTAPATGTLTGAVRDDRNGDPLAYAHVMVLGTMLGASTREDGTFTVNAVPAGSYRVQVSVIGYESQTQPVVIPAGGTADVRFRLKSVLAATEKEVVVTAERPLVDVKSTSTIRAFDSEEISSMTLQPTLDNLVEQQPGVTRVNDRIHIRGGRSDEALYIVDGVQMRDLITGESKGMNVSSRSLAEVNIITGGFDARFGQALAGVIEAKTKEGGERLQGWFGYQTDRLLSDEQVDLWELELGGPAPLLDRVLRPLGARDQRRPNFYLSLGVDLKNGYLPGIDDLPGDRHLRSSYQERFFGLDGEYGRFFYPRANNSWRLNLKTSWQASAPNKFVLALSKSLAFHQGFRESDPSEISRDVSGYAWTFRDTWNRYYTVSEDQNSASVIWIHTFRPDRFHTLKLTRFFSSRHQDVMGKLYSEYDILGLQYDENGQLIDSGPVVVTRPDPYFRVDDELDATLFRDRFTRAWSLDSDWVHKWRRHDIRWGMHHQYETVQQFSLDASTISPTQPLGKSYDLFKAKPSTGALYVQDQIEQEGLVAKFGLRFDYWFPGRSVERLYEQRRYPYDSEMLQQEWRRDTRSLFGRRFKGELLPRISISHPITERDHLFFSYGHFTQRPAYHYVYTKTGATTGEEFPNIGNPNLKSETSVQYEFGAGHTFRENMSAKLTLFFKDIYNYPISIPITFGDYSGQRSNFLMYFNRDYSRMRGIELEVRRRQGTRASWVGTYSYSVVKGKSSDPNQLALVRALGGDARVETALGEEYMSWNQPHKLTVSFDYRVPRGETGPRLPFGLHIPGGMSLNLYYLIQSGRAYTPQDIFGAETAVKYSRNGPPSQTLNGTLRQSFRLLDRRWEASLQGWNLFDQRNLLTVDPVTGERLRIGAGSLARSTYSLPYLRGMVSDPSARSAPRNLRIGLGVEL